MSNVDLSDTIGQQYQFAWKDQQDIERVIAQYGILELFPSTRGRAVIGKQHFKHMAFPRAAAGVPITHLVDKAYSHIESLYGFQEPKKLEVARDYKGQMRFGDWYE